MIRVHNVVEPVRRLSWSDEGGHLVAELFWGASVPVAIVEQRDHTRKALTRPSYYKLIKDVRDELEAQGYLAPGEDPTSEENP